MPSAEHESPLELTRRAPELVAWLLSSRFGVDVPAYASAQEHPTEVRAMIPRTYHADGVVAFRDAEGRAVLGAVVENQRSRDGQKLRSWKLYVSALEAELCAPAALVVFCPRPVATWYERRIEADGGSSLPLRPYLITPDRVPLITDPETAGRRPAAAVLATLLHAGEPGIDQAFPALMDAMLTLSPERFILYYDVVLAGLPSPARERWEAYMSIIPAGYTFKSELLRNLVEDATAKGEAEGRAKGEAEGRVKGEAEGRARGEAQAKAEDVLAVLRARGLTVSDAVRESILATTDLDLLGTWLLRAVTADTAESVVAD